TARNRFLELGAGLRLGDDRGDLDAPVRVERVAFPPVRVTGPRVGLVRSRTASVAAPTTASAAASAAATLVRAAPVLPAFLRSIPSVRSLDPGLLARIPRRSVERPIPAEVVRPLGSSLARAP